MANCRRYSTRIWIPCVRAGRSAERCAMRERLAADRAINSKAEHFVEVIKAVIAGKPVAVDCSACGRVFGAASEIGHHQNGKPRHARRGVRVGAFYGFTVPASAM